MGVLHEALHAFRGGCSLFCLLSCGCGAPIMLALPSCHPQLSTRAHHNSLVCPNSLVCSADEVAHLVLALFEDTDLRRDFLRSLEQDTLL